MSATLNGDGTVSQDGGTVTDLMSGLAKSWANINGTTPSVRASFNMSSLTDHAVGSYKHNFTNSMSAANGYAVGGMGRDDNALTATGSLIMGLYRSNTGMLAASFWFTVTSVSNAPFDADEVTLSVSGGLA